MISTELKRELFNKYLTDIETFWPILSVVCLNKCLYRIHFSIPAVRTVLGE